MTRGTDAGRVPDDVLINPFPIAHRLPGVYQEDDFAQRLCAALDDVWTPMYWVLDNRDAYFDPALAPTDFVQWLASWVGLALDERWTLEQQRALVADAGRLYQWRGTVRGVRELVRLYSGADAEVIDSGGTSWSARPGSEYPGDATHQLVVRLPVEMKAEADHVDAIVAAAKPAHVAHVVEVSAL
jgi:phage tail-like protein